MMGGGRTPFSGRFQAVLGLRDGDGVARGSAMEAMIRASLRWGKDDGGGGIGQWRRMWFPKIAAPAGDRIGGASRRLAALLLPPQPTEVRREVVGSTKGRGPSDPDRRLCLLLGSKLKLDGVYLPRR